jgi:hypothetical protein
VSAPAGSRVCIECMAGSARLTAACEAAGLTAFGVDHKGNRHRPEGRVVVLDLTSPSDQLPIKSMLTPDSDVVFVWFGLPCGTMSRARNIPLADRRGPQPLRSERHPRGLPALGPADAAKVAAANALVSFARDCITLCDLAGIKWAIENPARSLLWWFPEMIELVAHARAPPTIDVLYDACMLGGERPKHQRIRTTFVELAALGSPPYGACDGSHRHKPWGINAEGTFNTAQEAEYPYQFCNVVAQLVAKHTTPRASSSATSRTTTALAAARPPRPPARTPAELRHKLFTARRRAATGLQPRGRAHGPLVPEYHTKQFVKVHATAASLTSLLHRRPKDAPLSLGQREFPPGTTVITIRDVMDRGQESADDTDGNADNVNDDGPSSWTLCEVGVPWTPDQFFAEAKLLAHPFQAQALLPDRLLRAIHFALVEGPSATVRYRWAWIERWRNRAAALREAEARLHAAAHPDVRPFLEGKSVLLLGEMLAEAGVPNHRGIVDLMLQGVPMFGEFPRTGIFREKYVKPTKSIEDLFKSARWARNALLGSMRSSGSTEVDHELWRRTCAEVEKGWLTGPFNVEQLTERLGPLWVAARRFPAPRDARPIDDYSEYSHNATAENYETADLDGVDTVVGLIKTWARAVLPSGDVRLELADGEVLGGRLHPEWGRHRSAGDQVGVGRLLGRTLDLESAFKQLARHPACAPLAVVCVWDPVSGAPALFLQTSLAFGARNSVLGFNWCSRGLEWIFTASLGLACVAYVDDYPHVEPPAIATAGREVMESALELVGWRFKALGPKAPDFAHDFAALGVRFDLGGMPNTGQFKVYNKPERAEKVEAVFREVENAGILRAPIAASLRGMLQFASAQVFGRAGALGLRALSRFASGPNRRVDAEVRGMIEFWRRFFQNARPRQVDARSDLPPILIFTDASAEGDDFSRVGVGAVMYDPADQALEFFSGVVDTPLVDSWRRTGQKQVIGQAEIFPVLMSRYVWASRLEGRPNITFIDNMSAMDALIKGLSNHDASLSLVADTWAADSALQTASWYDRVPSASNPADAPSRGDAAGLLAAGAVRRRPVVPPPWSGFGGVTDWNDVRPREGGE